MAETTEERRLALEKATQDRRTLEKFAKSIGSCDGEDPTALREWLRGMDHASKGSGTSHKLVIEMAVYLAGGDLGEFILETSNAMDQATITWVAVRDQVINSFLSVDECDQLQDQVYRMRQGPEQMAWEFGRKFRAACVKAFPAEELKLNFLQKTLSRCFTQGLRQSAVRQEVFGDRPVKLEAAIKKATETAQALHKASQSEVFFSGSTSEMAALRGSLGEADNSGS